MPLRNPAVSDYFGNRSVKKRSHLAKFSIAFKKPSVKCQGLNERDTICFFAVVIDGTTFSLTDFRLHGVSLDYGRLLN